MCASMHGNDKRVKYNRHTVWYQANKARGYLDKKCHTPGPAADQAPAGQIAAGEGQCPIMPYYAN